MSGSTAPRGQARTAVGERRVGRVRVVPSRASARAFAQSSDVRTALYCRRASSGSASSAIVDDGLPVFEALEVRAARDLMREVVPGPCREVDQLLR